MTNLLFALAFASVVFLRADYLFVCFYFNSLLLLLIEMLLFGETLPLDSG